MFDCLPLVQFPSCSGILLDDDQPMAIMPPPVVTSVAAEAFTARLASGEMVEVCSGAIIALDHDAVLAGGELTTFPQGWIKSAIDRKIITPLLP